ncbi:MAG TPA: LysR family transcriptional regulator [Sulfuriferula sp.]|nr:LysR family transcriptional regulator [Sulfuriferula sp.]
MTDTANIHIRGRIWLTVAGKNMLGRGRVELLEKIGATGSISQAARAMKMSYKAAWDAVDAMGNALNAPLVSTSTGGKGGGGARLTPQALALIAAYRQLEQRHQDFLGQLEQEFASALTTGEGTIE